MELNIWTGLMLAIFATVALYGWRPVQRWKLRRIPGPRGWWLLGNAPQLSKLGSHKAFQHWAAVHGPVYKASFASWSVVVVAHPTLARSVMRCSSLRPHTHPISCMAADYKRAMSTTLLFSNGPIWRQLRPAWQSSFLPSSLKTYQNLMHEAALRLIEEVDVLQQSGLQIIDVQQLAGDLAFDVIAAAGLGWRTAAQTASGCSTQRWKQLRQDAATLFKSAQSSPWVLLYATFQFLLPFLRVLSYLVPDRLMASVLSARKRLLTELQDSLNLPGKLEQGHISRQSLFLQKLTGDGLGKAETGCNAEVILEQALLMLLAGYETSSSTIAFACHLLSLHDNLSKQEALYSEIQALGHSASIDDILSLPYLDAVVKESLRMLPPAHLTVREASEAMTVGGFDIPKGQWILIPIYTIHHDKKIWGEDADNFLPERWLEVRSCPGLVQQSFLPFGAGVRSCPGARFALQEAKITLFHLLRKFSMESKAPLKVRTSATMAPQDGVWLRIWPRNSKPEQAQFTARLSG